MKRIPFCKRLLTVPALRCGILAILTLTPAATLFAQVADIPDSSILLQVNVSGPKGQPLQGAEIRLDEEVLGYTDESGAFYLPRKPREARPYTLSVSAVGYETRKQNISIPSEPGSLPVRVWVELHPFVPKPPSSVGKPAPNYRVYEVFYATDRLSSRSKDPETYYAGQRSRNGELELGSCEISIPVLHQRGVLEGPSYLHLEFQFDPDKHIFLRLPQPLAADKFYDKLAFRVNQSSRKELFVFIHGYNTTFAQAARKAAQLAADLDFNGPPILYSWPSAGMFRGYFTDEKNVEWSVPHLREFLEQIALRSHATRVHLIAHSMGNRAMSRALQEIGKKRYAGQAPRFQQIVLAAPDIRINQIQQLERAMLPLGKRVTLYASRNDDALILARIIDGVARAGEHIAAEIAVPGLDVLDASAVRTDFIGHGYFAESLSVIGDLKQLLLQDAAPESRRGLLQARLANFLYWVIPPAEAVAAK